MEQKLAAGMQRLFGVLPAQSAFRKPLAQLLLADLTVAEIEGLDLPGLSSSTAERYLRDSVDVTELQRKRRRVIQTPSIEDQSRIQRVRQWLLDNFGVTQSGRILTVLKTEMRLTALFHRYVNEVPKPISINRFHGVCKLMHVHFGVGAVDTMSCVLCRDWKSQLEALQSRLDSGTCSTVISKRLQKEMKRLEDDLRSHEEAFVKQLRSWQHDVETTRSDLTLCLVVLDFSTFDLMDRKTTSVLSLMVLRCDKDRNITRSYFDFVDLPISGRKRDASYFALTGLWSRGVFKGIQRVRLWADAGSGDFRNAPGLYGFVQLEKVCVGVTFESFNFFGARHGWSDVDRHFGNAKKHIDCWMANEATRDLSLKLDVAMCCRLLAQMPQCIAFRCSNVKVFGLVADSVPGLIQHYSFRRISRTNSLRACKYSSDSDDSGKIFDLSHGSFVSAADAAALASARKQKTKQIKPSKRKRRKTNK